MKPYVILLRGVNVGGKNKIPMAELRSCLEDLGFSKVSTYIASGNIVLLSDRSDSTIKDQIESILVKKFKLDSELIKVLVLSYKQLKNVIDNRPNNFGDQPNVYNSDVIFLIDLKPELAMRVFDPREGVDKVWSRSGVIYSQRLTALRTKSRLNKIISSFEYKSMTIRNWNTVIALLRMIEKLNADAS